MNNLQFLPPTTMQYRYVLKMACIRLRYRTVSFVHVWDNVQNKFVEIDAVTLGIEEPLNFITDELLSTAIKDISDTNNAVLNQTQYPVIRLCNSLNKEDMMYLDQINLL